VTFNWEVRLSNGLLFIIQCALVISINSEQRYATRPNAEGLLVNNGDFLDGASRKLTIFSDFTHVATIIQFAGESIAGVVCVCLGKAYDQTQHILKEALLDSNADYEAKIHHSSSLRVSVRVMRACVQK